MGDHSWVHCLAIHCVTKPSRSTQPCHPYGVSTVSTIKSWHVNRYTMQNASPVTMICQCKLVSSGGLR